MGVLTFKDGVKINTSGPLRLEHKSDGWYVLGNGMSIPVHSQEEGERWIDKLKH